MGILVRNGTVFLANEAVICDLRIIGEKIVEIGENLPVDGCQVVDATGKLVCPGFIDTHTHLEMNAGLPNETADDWKSGTLAALAGGTTTILDFAEAPRGGSLMEALDIWHKRADGVASCHYSFHMTFKEWSHRVAEEIPQLAAAGITSFKVYMAYDNLQVDEADMAQLLTAVAQVGGIVGCHCEVGEQVKAGVAEQHRLGRLDPSGHPLSRPPVVEAQAVERWLKVADKVGVPVNIVHLSSEMGLDVARDARSRGQIFYVETCPQYLVLDDSKYNLPDFESAKYVLSPPLRGKEDVDALWKGVADGMVDTVGTDHCSFHFLGAKQLGRDDFAKIPNGLPGIEHRPILLYTAGVASGKMTAGQWVKLLSEQPARLFGMYPQKGCLAVGSDADVVIFDPNFKGEITAVTQHQAVDYTPYEGFETVGRVETVVLSGKIAVENGRVVTAGCGRFVPRGKSEGWR